MALITIGVGIWLGRDIYSLAQERDQPGTVAQAYARAIQARDWTQAQGYLSHALRAETSPGALQATWQQREQTNGSITGFTATYTNLQVFNGIKRATVTGTIGYSRVAPEAKTLHFVKEGSDWKLANLP